ncbi:MAG: DUF3943 domain-containing protein [Gemmatimonadota bacterium]
MPAGADAQTPRVTVASCDDQRTMEAVAQTLGVNLVVNRANAWVFGWDWAHVGFESWSSNLEKGWQWDETQFAVNMFVHPYHGSLYFNAARGNCLTFWEAVPITFLGSWTWEYFGETFRPSLNDFWMTGYGGVVLGEMLHRLSAAVIDQQASGAGRIGRELAATVIDPMGGFNRLIRGDWTRQSANPDDRLPGSYLARMKAGGRRVREDGDPESSTSSPTLLLEVRFGDVIDTEYRAPFDVINMLAQVSPDGGGVNILRAVGRLYGRDLTSAGSRHRHELVINQRFDYVNNPVYHFGEQSLEMGVHSRWRTGPGGLRLNTRLAGDIVMLGAIDALDAGMGQRDIDYGPGLGALLEVSLDLNGSTYVSFYNRVRYLRSVSGAPADHTILFSGFDVTIPLTSEIGIGAYVSGDSRYSHYSDLPNDSRSYLETRIYVTWNLAHRTAGR